MRKNRICCLYRGHWNTLRPIRLMLSSETSMYICDHQSLETSHEKTLVTSARKMTMNISTGQPCVSICCKQDTVHILEARCYWNVSITAVQKIIPNLLPSKIPTRDLQKMIPGEQIPCPNNTVCYSDCNSGNNISTYLFGNPIISINDSMDIGLACRFDSREYCFQSHTTDKTENITSVCNTFFDLETTMKFSEAQFNIEWPFAVYPMTISCLFLAATFFIYTIIPELKNLHGLILRTYMLCCFGCFLVLMLVFRDRTMSCSAFSMIPLHFMTVATCCWLNVMSFDIWWTFRYLRESSKQSSRKKYIIYSIYAWGIPTLIIGVGFIIEFLPNAPEGIIKPGLQEGCWLGGMAEFAVYINIPLTITVPCNICCFVLAAISITRQKKATSQYIEGSDSRRFNDEKNRFYLYLKLFLVTGMTWVAEVAVYHWVGPNAPYVTCILRFPTRMQGLIFFIIFGSNSRIKRLLSKHLALKDRAAIQWMEHAVARIRTLVRRPQVA